MTQVASAGGEGTGEYGRGGALQSAGLVKILLSRLWTAYCLSLCFDGAAESGFRLWLPACETAHDDPTSRYHKDEALGSCLLHFTRVGLRDQ